MRSALDRRPVAVLVAVLAVAGLVPLLLLTYLSLSLAGDVVRRETTAHVESTARVGALVAEREMLGLAELVDAYAKRVTLIESLEHAGSRGARARIHFHLGQLAGARQGITIAFVTDARGTLLDIVPRTPAIVGRDFRFRDWYRGVTERGRPYVSEAYVSAARGRPRVVAAAAPVQRDGERRLGILVAAYSLDHLQRFIDRFALREGVHLVVTDQRGTIVAAPGASASLVSLAGDRRVAEALKGRSGSLEHRGALGRQLSAYVPVTPLGWTVSASVPTKTAFARVRPLGRTVTAIAALLALVYVAGLGLLAAVLRSRASALGQAKAQHESAEEARRLLGERNEELEAAASELESQNTELELQTVELEDRQHRLAAANDELAAQRGELERALGALGAEKERIDALYRFGEVLAAQLELDQLARTILIEVCRLADCEVGALYVADDNGGFRLAAARGLSERQLPDDLDSHDALAATAVRERRSVWVSHGDSPLTISVLGEGIGLHHQLYVPLLQADRALGVLTLARVGDRPFAREQRLAVEHLCRQATVAVANALSYRSERRLGDVNRAVLDATRDGIALVDFDGRVVLANTALETLSAEFGHDLRADPNDRIAAAAERTTDAESLRGALRSLVGDAERETVLEFALADGQRAFQLYTAPVPSEEGAPLGRLYVLHEVTAEREGERLKAELMATVSHELRTPLASIVGFSELLIGRTLDEASRTTYAEIIHAESRRLTDLINDFLDVQRIEEEELALALSPLDLGDLVRQQVDVFRAQSSAHTLELSLPDGPLAVLGERDRLAQVLANLLSNAIKYSPGGGLVRVVVAERYGYARVSVTDEGVGIPSAQQARIFTKFFRVDSSDTRAIGGTGLGLALSRALVEAHGGRIGFESVEGAGSTFWFELPAGDTEVKRATGRALVIEDDPGAAALLSSLLTLEGLTVDVVPTGEDGLTRVERDPPTLVCLDIGLPGSLDGWAVLTRLKSRPETAHIPVVVCTGSDTAERALLLGAADVLTKPFSPERLQQAVVRALPDRPASVLVVDDDETVRRLVARTLAGDGLSIREAADGEEALAALEAAVPDAMVLDLVMPGLDGFGVLARIQERAETRLLPVVVLTARDLSPDELSELRSHTQLLLPKSSYSASELRRLVRQALGRANGAR